MVSHSSSMLKALLWQAAYAISTVSQLISKTNSLDTLDPRVWVREGEKTMTKRVAIALDDFNTAGQL